MLVHNRNHENMPYCCNGEVILNLTPLHPTLQGLAKSALFRMGIWEKMLLCRRAWTTYLQIGYLIYHYEKTHHQMVVDWEQYTECFPKSSMFQAKEQCELWTVFLTKGYCRQDIATLSIMDFENNKVTIIWVPELAENEKAFLSILAIESQNCLYCESFYS